MIMTMSQLQLVGVLFPAIMSPAAEYAEPDSVVPSTLNSTQQQSPIDQHSSPQGAIPIVSDGTHQFAVVHNLGMPEFRGINKAELRPYDETRPELGGFRTIGELQEKASETGAEPDPMPSLIQLAARRMLERNDPETQTLLTALQTVPGSNSGDPSVAASSQATPKAEQVSDDSDGRLNYPLSPFTQYLASNGLATLLAGGNLNNALRNSVGNLGGIGMFFANQLIGDQVGKLFGKWKLDASSSTGEFAAKQAAQMLVSKLQGELMGMLTSKLFGASGANSPSIGKRIREFFLGLDSSATLGAALIDSIDDKADVVVAATAANVLVNSRIPAAALSGDVMKKSGAKILNGSTSVKLVKGSRMFSRKASDTMTPSKITDAVSANVLIGGKSPHSAATSAAAAALEAGKGDDFANRESERVDKQATVAEKKALENGDSPAEAKEKADRAATEAAKQKPVDPLTLAKLNQHAYRDGKGGFSGKDWKDIPKTELKPGDVVDTGDGGKFEVLEIIDADDNSSLPGGYRAVVFQNVANDQVVFAAQGTNFESIGNDWLMTNIAQGFGLVPGQYSQVVSDVERYQAQYPGMIVTGHSLGGGLATFAGAMTGLQTVTFNPAGLGAGSAYQIATNGVPVTQGQIQNYLVDGEALTGVSTLFGQPEPTGTSTLLPDVNPSALNLDSLSDHQMTAVREGLESGQVISTYEEVPKIDPVLAPS